MSYLRECYDLHPELTERKYGRRQDLSEIERSFEPIQETQCLTYDHIEILMTKGSLDVNMFGYWPARKEIESDLEKREFDFHNLPGAEEQVIRDLQSTFRQIQLVSVILRFVDKTNYGILSPPVEQILGIGPTRYHRQKYLLYVKNLQRIRNETDGLSAAAHVDMALWVLSVGVLNGELDDEPRVDRLRKQYDNDPLLRELRVENLTSQLFQTLDRRQLAEALNRCSALPANELAGQIAGIEFEKSIKGALTRAAFASGIPNSVCNSTRSDPTARRPPPMRPRSATGAGPASWTLRAVVSMSNRRTSGRTTGRSS